MVNFKREKVYFKEDGSLATGATKSMGKYNFAKDGSFKTGWQKKSERKQYYSSTGYLTKGWEENRWRKILL